MAKWKSLWDREAAALLLMTQTQFDSIQIWLPNIITGLVPCDPVWKEGLAWKLQLPKGGIHIFAGKSNPEKFVLQITLVSMEVLPDAIAIAKKLVDQGLSCPNEVPPFQPWIDRGLRSTESTDNEAR